MMHYNDAFYYDTLYHHGIKGMHWGIRRYQNKDGSLTQKGKARYKSGEMTERQDRKITSRYLKIKAKKAIQEHRPEYNEKFNKLSNADSTKYSIGRALRWIGFSSGIVGAPVVTLGNYLSAPIKQRIDTEFGKKYLKDLKSPSGKEIEIYHPTSVINPTMSKNKLDIEWRYKPKKKG